MVKLLAINVTSHKHHKRVSDTLTHVTPNTIKIEIGNLLQTHVNP
jgi:hypothetical protein